MAKKISDLPAVATPSVTDAHEVNQGGVSKQESNAQILTGATVHVNKTQVTVNGTSPATTLLDSAPVIASVAAGQAIGFELWGTIQDPGPNGPDLTFNILVGGVTVVTITTPSVGGDFYFKGLVTLRAVGPASDVIGSARVEQSNGIAFLVAQASINVTDPVDVNITGSIADFTGGENIIVKQAVIHRLF